MPKPRKKLQVSDLTQEERQMLASWLHDRHGEMLVDSEYVAEELGPRFMDSILALVSMLEES